MIVMMMVVMIVIVMMDSNDDGNGSDDSDSDDGNDSDGDNRNDGSDDRNNNDGKDKHVMMMMVVMIVIVTVFFVGTHTAHCLPYNGLAMSTAFCLEHSSSDSPPQVADEACLKSQKILRLAFKTKWSCVFQVLGNQRIESSSKGHQGRQAHP